jgi:hypothetical protein
MKINIDHLSRAELIELNTKIVERLRFLDQMTQHKEMLNFNIGEKVCFHDNSGDIQVGTLIKYNKKTVSILTEDGQKWNVSPTLLSRLKDIESDDNNDKSHIIDFKNISGG